MPDDQIDNSNARWADFQRALDKILSEELLFRLQCEEDEWNRKHYLYSLIAKNPFTSAITWVKESDLTITNAGILLSSPDKNKSDLSDKLNVFLESAKAAQAMKKEGSASLESIKDPVVKGCFLALKEQYQTGEKKNTLGRQRVEDFKQLEKRRFGFNFSEEISGYSELSMEDQANRERLYLSAKWPYLDSLTQNPAPISPEDRSQQSGNLVEFSESNSRNQKVTKDELVSKVTDILFKMFGGDPQENVITEQACLDHITNNTKRFTNFYGFINSAERSAAELILKQAGEETPDRVVIERELQRLEKRGRGGVGDRKGENATLNSDAIRQAFSLQTYESSIQPLSQLASG